MIRVIQGLWLQHRLPLRTTSTFTNLMEQPHSRNMASLQRKLLVDVPMSVPRELFAEKKSDKPTKQKEEKP